MRNKVRVLRNNHTVNASCLNRTELLTTATNIFPKGKDIKIWKTRSLKKKAIGP
jgi:hypothetical protein